MDVKPGYKQTEVGVIPEDWDLHSVGESMRLINGRAFKPSEWTDRGLPIIRIQNLNDADGSFNFFDGTVEDRHCVEPGELLFAWSGTTGTSFGARIWSGPRGVLNQHIFKVLPDRERLTRDYAFLVLHQMQESIEKQSHGFKASFVHVKKSDLLCVQLPLPATEQEQYAIATAVSDVDALIAKLDQLIAKKRDLKQAAMQELLTGRRRLPGFEGQWSAASLNELADIQPGLNKPASEMGFGTLYVSVQDLYEGTSIPISKLGRIRASAFEIETKKLLVGDIVFGKSSVKRDGIGYPSQFLGSNEPVIFSGFAYRARARVGVADPTFLFYALRADTTRRWVIDNSQASALTNINQKIAESIPVQVCSLNEQSAIATFLFDMDTEITALEARRDKTKLLKQGMMQELLTGRIRLVNPAEPNGTLTA